MTFVSWPWRELERSCGEARGAAGVLLLLDWLGTWRRIQEVKKVFGISHMEVPLVLCPCSLIIDCAYLRTLRCNLLLSICQRIVIWIIGNRHYRNVLGGEPKRGDNYSSLNLTVTWPWWCHPPSRFSAELCLACCPAHFISDIMVQHCKLVCKDNKPKL